MISMPSDYDVELENNRKIALEVLNKVNDEVRGVLAEVALKSGIVQSLDDGYGKVIVTIQRGKFHSVRLFQDHIVKPTGIEKDSEVV